MKKTDIFESNADLTKEDILSILENIEDYIGVNELVIIGGANCILKHGNYRTTEDIDNISGVDLEIKGVRINSDAEILVEMPIGYEERLEILPLKVDGYIALLVSDIDLILLKLHRASIKDWEDIDIMLDEFTIEDKLHLLEIGDEYVKDVVGMKFKNNWEDFRRRYLYATQP